MMKLLISNGGKVSEIIAYLSDNYGISLENARDDTFSFLNYEHAMAVEAEFKESMTHRAEKGYVLPGQMDLLYSIDNCISRMGNGRRVLVSALAMPKSQNLFSPEKSWDINTRSVAPYNNSFDSLVSDLKSYVKKGYRVLILSGSRTRAKRTFSWIHSG